MVLVAHVVLHLLLTALQLHHNLLVAHLDGLIVVPLARPQEIKGILAVLLDHIKRRLFVLIVISHFEFTLAALLFGLIHRIFHNHVLLRSKHRQFVAQRLIPLA